MVNKIKRQFSGIVVSDKMDKTIVVRVDRKKWHPRYGKQYIISKKYKVHDEENKFKQGDTVTFVACRPISGNKRWRILSKQKAEI